MMRGRLESLVNLYGQISGLHVLKSRLAHERFTVDAETSLPVRRFQPEVVFIRTGFCDIRERKTRLSCGHTSARYVLEDAIRLMDEPAQSVLQSELNELTSQIHSLDHQKGGAEKRLAGLICERHRGIASADIENEIAAAVARIKNIEGKHSDCVERIDGLRYRVLGCLEAAIAERRKDLRIGPYSNRRA